MKALLSQRALANLNQSPICHHALSISGDLVQTRQAGQCFLGLAENLGILFPHSIGALARVELYGLDIAYMHPSTMILDQALALKLACDSRYTRALDAHHLGQELMSKR